MTGLVILALMVLAVIIVPIIWPNPYNRVNPDGTLWAAPIGAVDPATGHVFILGSDKIGRDNFSLLFQAGRLSLAMAFIPTIAILIVGFAIGALAGYLGGWVDSLFMRLADFLLALPLLPAYLIAIRLLRANPRDAGRSYDSYALWEIMGTIILVFVIFGWMGISRLVRGLVLSLRSQPFVEAAQALGASNSRIMFRHLLPNTAAPLLVAGMFAVGDFIILEAVLSYFGLGIPDTQNPTVVSWGNMLAFSQDQAWFLTNLNPFEQIRGYLVIFPSILLLITVLSINFIGDGLRDVLDPRLHR
jgi:peptide/nickel transport system permease protein